MKIRNLVAPAVGALTFAIAGCGSAASNVGAASTPQTAAAAAVTIMVVSDPATIGTYTPPSAMARVGDTVRWTFVDKNPHTATADDAGGFNSTVRSSGQTFSHKFDKPGTYNYHCNIHPEMHGAVIIG